MSAPALQPVAGSKAANAPQDGRGDEHQGAWLIEDDAPDSKNHRRPEKLFDLADRGGLDVLQPDIRALGLTLQSRLAQAVSGHSRLKLAPHCWGSFLGTYKMLQLARGAPGILTCEIDHMTSDLFDDSLWTLRDGTIAVPDAPGTGLAIREDVFERCCLPGAWQIGDTRRGRSR